MARTISLVGLDCGSTTTSAVVAAAQLTTAALGRVEITDLRPTYQSEIVFTPLVGEKLDVARLEAYLDTWLSAAGVDVGEIFAGGALITGLAAQRANAAEVTRLFDARLAGSVVATADDPRLESWLAFLGNCHQLSLVHPGAPIVNLDVGGGTTNLAWGVDGQVTATACLNVGARHLRFRPGTYELVAISAYGAALLQELSIDAKVGATLSAADVAAVVERYFRWTEAAVAGDESEFNSPLGKMHLTAVPRGVTQFDTPPVVTLSGGVGQLSYQLARGASIDGTTPFGDLGTELAARLAAWPRFQAGLAEVLPQGLGRATVFGLLRHGTELSGSTIYLPRPGLLPLANVPIVGCITPDTPAARVAELLDLAARCTPAGCLSVTELTDDSAAVRAVGKRLADACAAMQQPLQRPLVLLLEPNLGKVLGGYATRWGTLDVPLVVVDEVPPRDAQFVRLGRPVEGTVPLSLYGIR